MNSNALAIGHNDHSISAFIPSQPLKKQRPLPRILLVDDDPIFGKIMTRAAGCFHADLGFIQTIEELRDDDLQLYDVAIIDYDLGAVTGVELARYFDHRVPMPVVMVSGTFRRPNLLWSESIHEFLLKGAGPLAILDAAFEAYELGVHRPG